MPATAGKVFAIGEVLWDLLPSGPVLGGAPANFAIHARSLGAQAALISRVGDDPRGREILEQLSAAGLPGGLIATDPRAPTGSVSVTLGGDGQPNYIIHENVAWDFIAAGREVRAAIDAADVVCFGSLAQRAPASREAIRSLVAAAPPAALRVFDINMRQSFYSREVLEDSLTMAGVLKLNDAELPVLAELFSLGGDVPAQLTKLAHLFHLRTIALTCGANGSLLLHDDEFSAHPGVAAEVRDTIGAGDSFTAALVLGLLRGWPLAQINQRANEVAAFVCGHSGATPPLPPRLCEAFASIEETA